MTTLVTPSGTSLAIDPTPNVMPAAIRGYIRSPESEQAAGTPIRFVATTEGMKRDGYQINLQGLSTEDYERNPIVLWVHDYWGRHAPIGRVTKIIRRKTAILVDVVFDQEDEFAASVESKYRRGYLYAVSIGWNVLEYDEASRTVVRSELLDVSAVPVPGDADALIERSKAMLRNLGRELLAAVPDDDKFLDPDADVWSLLRRVDVEFDDETDAGTEGHATPLTESNVEERLDRIEARLDALTPNPPAAAQPATEDDPIASVFAELAAALN